MALKSILAASLLSVSYASLAKRQTDISQNGCNGIIGDYYGTLYCCPGVAYDDNDEYPSGSGYCCVGAVFPIPASQFSDCYPNCGQTATSEGNGILPITSTQSCRTTIMFTDSEYTSKANAYGAGITGSLSIGTQEGTFSLPVEPTTTAPTETQSGTTVAPSTTSDTTGTATIEVPTTGFSGPAVLPTTGSSTAPPAQSTGIAARITSGPIAGAFMVAGGILAAAI